LEPEEAKRHYTVPFYQPGFEPPDRQPALQRFWVYAEIKEISVDKLTIYGRDYKFGCHRYCIYAGLY
jgi:hypothetical protein